MFYTTRVERSSNFRAILINLIIIREDGDIGLKIILVPVNYQPLGTFIKFDCMVQNVQPFGDEH